MHSSAGWDWHAGFTEKGASGGGVVESGKQVLAFPRWDPGAPGEARGKPAWYAGIWRVGRRLGRDGAGAVEGYAVCGVVGAGGQVLTRPEARVVAEVGVFDFGDVVEVFALIVPVMRDESAGPVRACGGFEDAECLAAGCALAGVSGEIVWLHVVAIVAACFISDLEKPVGELGHFLRVGSEWWEDV
jgi:hypothetical protein